MLDGLRAAAAAPPLTDDALSASLWSDVEGLRAARKMAERRSAAAEPAAPAGGALDQLSDLSGAGEGGDMNGARAADAVRRDRASELRRRLEETQYAALRRAVASPHGFAERMAAFWADHFTVAIKYPAHWTRIAAFEDVALRPHLAGRFEDMLAAVVQHPAMLIYLDQDRSVGPSSPIGRRRGAGLNENLAREVLELHTLGVGAPYSQADVQALARLLTGFGLSKGRFRYRRRAAEPGRITLMGRDFDGASRRHTLRALRRLARHPATARHLAGKLAVHFVGAPAPRGLVSALTATWRRTDGDLAAVCEPLLTHPAAASPLGAKVRQPREALVAALRAAGAAPEQIGAAGPYARGLTLAALRDMGQSPNRALGPDGWPEDPAHWITPGGMAARLAWASRMGVALARLGLDPRDYARAALDDALGEDAAWAIAAAAERWEGHALLLASPDFNRR